MIELSAAQAMMREKGIDFWILYDFRGSNDVLWQLLGEHGFTTRRCFLTVPATGEPTALVHQIDQPQVGGLFPAGTTYYRAHPEINAWLGSYTAAGAVVATEYSPSASIPTLSSIDGGTLDLLRAHGAEVVSSAELFQEALATWSGDAAESHRIAVEQVVECLDEALAFVVQQVTERNEVSEYEVQQQILAGFATRGLETIEEPVVAVNENSGIPHYMPSATQTAQIRRGDHLLIDLWARRPGNANVYADITWMASVGANPSAEQVDVFRIVAAARDAVVDRLQTTWQAGETVYGWQLDDISRAVIAEAGYADYFIHRTGHSIGPGTHLHALGVNIDNYETHDIRPVTTGVGFSVEPGIYLENFGVRSEINVFVDPVAGPIVTTPLQHAIQVLTL